MRQKLVRVEKFCRTTLLVQVGKRSLQVYVEGWEARSAAS